MLPVYAGCPAGHARFCAVSVPVRLPQEFLLEERPEGLPRELIEEALHMRLAQKEAKRWLR
jgi:hypothetical protein